MAEWVNHEFCVSCRKRLTFHQVMHSMGRCPRCGYKERGAVTIVATFERGARWVPDPTVRWWQFWRRNAGHWEYLEDSRT